MGDFFPSFQTIYSFESLAMGVRLFSISQALYVLLVIKILNSIKLLKEKYEKI